MLIDIKEVRPLENYQLHLCFEDGVHGSVDVAKLVRFEGVFAPLKSPEEFQKVRVNPELGTVCWPCGADLDPDVLYSLVTGKPIPVLRG